MAQTLRQAVEVFHLVFLAELGTKLDRALYAIKGGCNLRFFFGSIRYSEDLDLDVSKVAKDTLRRKVDQILEGRSLTSSLAARKIEISAVSRPKQTDTTQRWKIELTLPQPAHTKIEFSRRGLAAGVEFGPADRAVVGSYGLTPTLLSHYGRVAAFEQKVQALVGRNETQARDVFDLHLLLSGSTQLNANTLQDALRDAAVERAMSVDFGMFKSQVVAYLPAEQQAAYGTKQVWEQMVLRVVDALHNEQP
jgi:predicted nucleotidyltransferase component of viral defense system